MEQLNHIVILCLDRPVVILTNENPIENIKYGVMEIDLHSIINSIEHEKIDLNNIKTIDVNKNKNKFNIPILILIGMIGLFMWHHSKI